ncbi:MAG: heavy-metal-associated domain-containing protein [Proteobacteria bacterium]|nr:heavy-metal-associated domain-containing protein [Pseudomonadota bacterium]
MAKKYSVMGMTCGGCASAVTKAIMAAAPGTDVDVDLDAKLVSVEGLEDDATVQKAVEGAGFVYGGPG